MIYPLALLLTSVIFGIVFFLRKTESSHSEDGNIKEDKFPDLNKLFLDHAAHRKVVKLVKTFNPSDQMILRSLLAADGLDSYVKSNLFGDLYGISRDSIFSTTVIEVFEDSVTRAKIIVQDYILNLQNEKKIGTGENRDHPQFSEIPGSDLKYIPELLV